METLFSTRCFYAAFAGYGCGLVGFLALIISEKRAFRYAGFVCMIAAFSAHTLALVFRTLEFQHAPVANMFEFMIVLAWFAGLGFFIVVKVIKNSLFVCMNIFFVLLLMLIVALLPSEGTENLMPALRSYWLVIHVTAAAASEGLFAIACAASILFLIKSSLRPEQALFRRLPELKQLDTIAYRMIAVGYILFTLGALFAGAIWAHRAWGSFWSWDPKETCSLVVWIIYSAYLHLRINRKAQGKLPHLLSVTGFLAALLTFFSSMFLGGLHSYG